MGSIKRTLGPAFPFGGLRTEREIVQGGDRLLAGPDPATRRRADQQAWLLSKEPRFGMGEQSLLSASVATSYPKLDPVAKEKLQLAEFSPWDARYEQAAARLVASAYREYADGEIDALYRSPEAALKLVHRLTREEHGGEPLPAASFVAREPRTGELCGLLLRRRVAPDAAQGELLCVAPSHQRSSGLGLALVRAGLQALVQQGLRSVGLQVAQANTEAARIYRRAGFQVGVSSALCVWEGFDAHDS
jgi:ribosomal protein S18 acetylase RimI-like enzyme